MRIRSVKPEFFTDSVTGSLRFEAQILYLGIQCLADRNGYFDSTPEELSKELFPQKRIKSRRVKTWLNNLIKAKLVEPMRCVYSKYPNKKLLRRGIVYRVIGFDVLHTLNDKERDKFFIQEIQQQDAQRGQQVLGVLVSGPGSLDTGTGVLGIGGGTGTRSGAPNGDPTRPAREEEKDRPPSSANPPVPPPPLKPYEEQVAEFLASLDKGEKSQ